MVTVIPPPAKILMTQKSHRVPHSLQDLYKQTHPFQWNSTGKSQLYGGEMNIYTGAINCQVLIFTQFIHKVGLGTRNK